MGAYVGLGNYAARGVPSRFVAGGEKEKDTVGDGGKEDGEKEAGKVSAKGV